MNVDFTLHWREKVGCLFKEGLIGKSLTNASNSTDCIKPIYNRCVLQTAVFKNGVANATLYFKFTLKADTSLCGVYPQETGYNFELHFILFPEACLLEEKYFLASSTEAHLKWKTWFSSFFRDRQGP